MKERKKERKKERRERAKKKINFMFCSCFTFGFPQASPGY